MSETILNVSGVSKRFGGLQALSDVGIKIERGQVYGLIGPNGAGKTTMFNAITGALSPNAGRIELLGVRQHRLVYVGGRRPARGPPVLR